MANPSSRFDELEYEPDPDAYEVEDGIDRATRYLPDSSKSVISRNTSPDIPFDISLNPYRGCTHGCSYCLSPDTPVLMADGSYRAIQSLRTGDHIFGTHKQGHYRRFVRTEVLDHWTSYRHAFRVTLGDGTELIASGDHRFLTERGWKHVAGTVQGRFKRPHLTLNNRLLGTGRFATSPEANEEYKRGYLCGIIRGDGHLAKYKQVRKGRSPGYIHQFRLALTDPEPLDRTRRYLAAVKVAARSFVFSPASATRAQMVGIRAQTERSFSTISRLVEWPQNPLEDWQKGFLAGIFDAEGAYQDGILRMFNTDNEIIDAICAALDRFAFNWTPESRVAPSGKNLRSIRVTGGLQAHLRFFHLTDPAITRKRSIEGQAIKNSVDLRVTKIEDLGIEIPMFDITTGTGDFIADGVVSHNCYARPSHEYLGFSPGLDFERMIMVKEDAPQLLEAELRKKSWEPKTMLLSGVTDPYQPVERRLQLTRRCLEVLRDFRHPVSVITKNHLVTRDIDLLAELASYAAAHVTLSITTLNEELRRRMEPRTATGQRRIDAVKQLSAAGIPVSVNIAPVIPGLNDEEIPAIMEAAAAAGASSAHFILVRLPGAVEPLFIEWLETHYPDRKEKVLGRLRESRGGKLNEAAFGKRMSGQGVYYESVRSMFNLSRKRFGLDERRFTVSGEHFRVPGSTSQPGLFQGT